MTPSLFVQPLPTDSKETWRRWARQKRSSLANPNLDDAVVKRLQAWKPYQQASHVLSYLAFGSEVNVTALHHDTSKVFYVPRSHPDYTLSIHPLSSDLEPHRYGFLQPLSSAPVIKASQIDLVLVPGLCFDLRGTRLGYGKGHYDRLLTSLLEVPRVGVTAEALVVEELPREIFDVPMSHLVTEQRVLAASQST